MAYNIFGETGKQINWEELHKKITPKVFIEYVPMPGKGVNGGDAIGISIPSKNFGNKAWEELKDAVFILAVQYRFKLYDMYYGTEIESGLLNKIKEILTT